MPVMTERETTLLLVRHGESVVTVRGVMGGEKSCEGLSDLGRRQAAALRDRWQSGGEPPVDVLVSSTLPRARETAEIVNEHLGLPIEEHKDLEEHRPGSVDGARFSDIASNGRRSTTSVAATTGSPRVPSRPRSSSSGCRVPSRRSSQRTRARPILVACHGGVIDVAFRTFLDLPARGHFDLFTLNTSITELRVDDHGPRRGRWRLLRYNDHAHLAGLPAETPGSRSGRSGNHEADSPSPDAADCVELALNVAMALQRRSPVDPTGSDAAPRNDHAPSAPRSRPRSLERAPSRAQGDAMAADTGQPTAPHRCSSSTATASTG